MHPLGLRVWIRATESQLRCRARPGSWTGKGQAVAYPYERAKALPSAFSRYLEYVAVMWELSR